MSTKLDLDMEWQVPGKERWQIWDPRELIAQDSISCATEKALIESTDKKRLLMNYLTVFYWQWQPIGKPTASAGLEIPTMGTEALKGMEPET